MVKVKGNKMNIRKEEERDFEEIKKINDISFGGEFEGKLVANLRAGKNFILSLVAEKDGKIIGHIMYSRIKIGGIDSTALAPVCVIPEYQNMGIGSRLIEKSLEMLKNMGEKSVIVLGHDKYYPKFGFETASKYGIKCPYDVPDEAFMALELGKDSLKSGMVEYGEEFSM